MLMHLSRRTWNIRFFMYHSGFLLSVEEMLSYSNHFLCVSASHDI